MDRGVRQILNSKAVKNVLQMGAPAIREGTNGDERLSKVSDGIRLYRKALGKWWYVKLSDSKTSSTIPIATAILVGGIKVGTGLAVTTDGTLSATGAGANNYLDGITRATNTLTFSVNGATDVPYTFGSNAFTSTTILALGTTGGTALEGDTEVTNWSGGSGGLTASTGRASLELGSMAQETQVVMLQGRILL